jgi:hypothetical protein
LTLKYANPCNKWALGLQLATLYVAAAASLNAQAKALMFEQVFNPKGEPAALHYQAVYTAKGEDHQLEVWRDGDRRVKRRTDDAVEMVASHNPGDAEFHLSILDKKKRIHTQIDRTNMYRIGNFADWFDLAHGLRHPKGTYLLSSATAPESAPKTAALTCKWYDLTQDNRTTHVCWSANIRLPMLIMSAQGKVIWRVTSLDQKPIPEKTFKIQDEGYVRNDANEDIESD